MYASFSFGGKMRLCLFHTWKVQIHQMKWPFLHFCYAVTFPKRTLTPRDALVPSLQYVLHEGERKEGTKREASHSNTCGNSTSAYSTLLLKNRMGNEKSDPLQQSGTVRTKSPSPKLTQVPELLPLGKSLPSWSMTY